MSGPSRRTRGRGGRGGHEPSPRIQQREARDYDLSLQGWSQVHIAKELGVSQPAISKLLRRVEDRMALDMAGERRRQYVRGMRQHEHIYGSSMQAFEQSKEPRTERRQRKVLGVGQRESTVVELVTVEGYGDPRYLEVARRAVVDKCKLAGLDTLPIADSVTAEASHLNDDELVDRLLQVHNLLAVHYRQPLLDAGSPGTTTTGPMHGPLTALDAYRAYLEEQARQTKEIGGG